METDQTENKVDEGKMKKEMKREREGENGVYRGREWGNKCVEERG